MNYGLALGLGQGLQNSGQSMLQIAELKRQQQQDQLQRLLAEHQMQQQGSTLALQQQAAALQQKQFESGELHQRAGEAMQAIVQMPGGTQIDPSTYSSRFQGTPAEAFFKPPVGPSQGEDSGGPMQDQGNPNYTSIEPLAQYRAMSPQITAGIRNQGAMDRNVNTNATHAAIAAGQAQLAQQRMELAARIAGAKDVNEKRRLTLMDQGLAQKQSSLQMLGQYRAGLLGIGAQRANNTPGMAQERGLAAFGAGDAPDEFDPTDLVNQILQSGSAIPGPFQGPPQAQTPAPGGQPTQRPKIIGITPIK